MKIKQELEQDYKKYVEINKDDEYSKVCVDAGEVFGNTLDDGKTCDEAERTMLDAESGMTGFMVSMAMKAVAHFHPRGEEVRVWWNEKNGVKSDKNIVNTAILNIDDDGTARPEFESV